MADPYGDMFGDIFGTNFPRSGPPSTPPKKVQKSVPWEAKIIDGKYYVPLEQVSELLKINDALPAVRKGIDIRISDLKLKKEMGL